MEFIIRVPASSANIGPGFDCLGMALDLYLKVHVVTFTSSGNNGNTVDITFTSNGNTPPSDIPMDKRNLIIQSALHVIHRQSTAADTATTTTATTTTTDTPSNAIHTKINEYSLDLLPCSLALTIDNDIPISRGLGSSGTAIIAGAILANIICNFNLSKQRLLDYILDLESHPDNVGASLMGGIIAGFVLPNLSSSSTTTTTTTTTTNRCVIVNLSRNPDIKCVVVIPDFQLSTSLARSVLPLSYSREDSVSTTQRTTILSHMFSCPHPDPMIFHHLLSDTFHQPYRASLVPGMSEILADITPYNTDGLLGIVLSGAGPTILALATGNYDEIAHKIKNIFMKHEISTFTRVLSIVSEGASVSFSSS